MHFIKANAAGATCQWTFSPFPLLSAAKPQLTTGQVILNEQTLLDFRVRNYRLHHYVMCSASRLKWVKPRAHSEKPTNVQVKQFLIGDQNSNHASCNIVNKLRTSLTENVYSVIIKGSFSLFSEHP